MNIGQHTLKSYDQQLQQLSQLILDMGVEVRRMVLAAKQSFRTQNEDQIVRAKQADKIINELDQRIEEEATVVLALQSPMAIDLRFVISVIKITGMLERAGDLAKNTVKRSVRMGSLPPEPVLKNLESMADIIVEMLGSAMDAFQEKNTDKALSVWKRDQEIDDLYHNILGFMQKELALSQDNSTAFTHAVFAAKNLERIADYITSLARLVYYITSGKRAGKELLKNGDLPDNTHLN